NRDKSVGPPPNSVTTGGGFRPGIVLGFLFRCLGGGGGGGSSSSSLSSCWNSALISASTTSTC
ncbi:hypothetical protein A2U01_0103252, partial [Trifolium medium]|nr:hypothetical protein [Trifolium medium]